MNDLRSKRKPRHRPMPQWITAQHLTGFVLGLVLASLAVDHGLKEGKQSRPEALLPITYPGP